jgi:hypothetical protein
MRKNVLMFLLCIAGAFLNILISRLVWPPVVFPLFLDTIMTIAVTLFGGLLWGVITGALTNIITHSVWFDGWDIYLFTLCNIATAYIPWLFMRWFPRELIPAKAPRQQDTEKFFSSAGLNRGVTAFAVLMVLSFALCLAMSILGGLISGFIDLLRASPEYGIPGTSHSVSFTTFKQNIPFLKNIIDRIPINSVDRAVSVLAGYGVFWVMNKVRGNKAPLLF